MGSTRSPAIETAATRPPMTSRAPGPLALLALGLGLGLAMLFASARAEIPDSYSPVILTANPESAAERVFDLTPAFERARRLNRRVLIYLGAAECPPCRRYTGFLIEHERELRPLFGRVVVVDVRTSIRGPRPTFLLDGQRYSTLEFKAYMGNIDPGLSYPTWWLVDNAGRQVRSLPRGVEQFLDVSRYRDWLAAN